MNSWPRLALLLVLAAAVGCGSKVAEAPPPPEPPAEEPVRLGTSTPIALAGWLKQSREELAKLADEYAVTVDKQQTATRLNIEMVDLLPQLHAPVRVPVFETCRYSPEAKLSLPPYLKPGQHDAAVALHLARHGDHFGARALANPRDPEVRARIDELRGDRDYPLEWTRLVALALQAAQFKMAHGELEGATELVLLHRQLREVLDPKAARGPLGAVLLPVGRHALQLAVLEWRKPKVKQTALAADVEAALKDWGDVPDPSPGLPVGADRAEVARLFGVRVPADAGGRLGVAAFAASEPEAVARALDLLALPVTPDGVNAVAAFIDARGRLGDVLVLYRSKIQEPFPEPEHLALYLLDRGYPVKSADAPGGLRRRVCEGGGLVYEVTALARGNVGGALVRVGPAGAREGDAPDFLARDPREWGLVHLDRTFEANRTNLDPSADPSAVKVTKPQTLEGVGQPVTAHAPQAVELKREPTQDLVASLTLRWPADLNHDGLHHLAVPLWAALGRGRLEGREEGEGGFLQWSWEADNTRIVLRLPFDEQPPELVVEDSRGTRDLAARAEAARQFDLRERQARLAAGHPQTRLPRSLQVNSWRSGGLQFEWLQLGQTRAEAMAAIPNSQTLRQVPLKDGVNILFTSQPPPSAPYWARQMFVRFGPDDRVAEVRVRYSDGPARTTGKGPALLADLRTRDGTPGELPGPWAGLWGDLERPSRSPVLYRWRDDRTLLTLQHDAGGSEVIFRDCPPQAASGVELAPLQFCDAGVGPGTLGALRADVLKRLGVTQPPTAANGAEVLPAPAGSPYDVVLAWYEQGRVSRVIARHRTGNPDRPGPEAAAAAVVAAWAANIDHLGYPRRIENQSGQVLSAYGWHDDVMRARIFVQDTENGPRLFTELRGWPVPPTSVASGR
jgi:hypothetical protein